MSVVLGRVYHVLVFVDVVAYSTRTCGTCRRRRRRLLLLYRRRRRRRWDDGAAAAVHTAQLSWTLFWWEGGRGLLQRGIRRLARSCCHCGACLPCWASDKDHPSSSVYSVCLFRRVLALVCSVSCQCRVIPRVGCCVDFAYFTLIAPFLFRRRPL